MRTDRNKRIFSGQGVSNRLIYVIMALVFACLCSGCSGEASKSIRLHGGIKASWTVDTPGWMEAMSESDMDFGGVPEMVFRGPDGEFRFRLGEDTLSEIRDRALPVGCTAESYEEDRAHSEGMTRGLYLYWYDGDMPCLTYFAGKDGADEPEDLLDIKAVYMEVLSDGHVGMFLGEEETPLTGLSGFTGWERMGNPYGAWCEPYVDSEDVPEDATDEWVPDLADTKLSCTYFWLGDEFMLSAQTFNQSDAMFTASCLPDTIREYAGMDESVRSGGQW